MASINKFSALFIYGKIKENNIDLTIIVQKRIKF
jgi:hypothetical protein